jgi:hypothetical protein
VNPFEPLIPLLPARLRLLLPQADSAQAQRLASILQSDAS